MTGTTVPQIQWREKRSSPDPWRSCAISHTTTYTREIKIFKGFQAYVDGENPVKQGIYRKFGKSSLPWLNPKLTIYSMNAPNGMDPDKCCHEGISHGRRKSHDIHIAYKVLEVLQSLCHKEKKILKKQETAVTGILLNSCVLTPCHTGAQRHDGSNVTLRRGSFWAEQPRKFSNPFCRCKNCVCKTRTPFGIQISGMNSRDLIKTTNVDTY